MEVIFYYWGLSMSKNVKQVYDLNPTTTIPNDALIYLGLSPYGVSDDSAVKSQDVFPASVLDGNITLFNGTSGKKLKEAALINGQLFIGSTGSSASPSTITAGSGIIITNGAGSITIAASGGGITWIDVVASPQAATDNHGYIADTGVLLIFTLPTPCAIGTTFQINGKGAGGWTITQSANQLIHVGSSVTTTGVGGSLSSTNRYDCVTITCITANLEFSSYAIQGNLNPI